MNEIAAHMVTYPFIMQPFVSIFYYNINLWPFFTTYLSLSSLCVCTALNQQSASEIPLFQWSVSSFPACEDNVRELCDSSCLWCLEQFLQPLLISIDPDLLPAVVN